MVELICSGFIFRCSIFANEKNTIERNKNVINAAVFNEVSDMLQEAGSLFLSTIAKIISAIGFIAMLLTDAASSPKENFAYKLFLICFLNRVWK